MKGLRTRDGRSESLERLAQINTKERSSETTDIEDVDESRRVRRRT